MPDTARGTGRSKVAPEPTDKLLEQAQAFNALFDGVVERNRERTARREAEKQAERDAQAELERAFRAAKEEARAERLRRAG